MCESRLLNKFVSLQLWVLNSEVAKMWSPLVLLITKKKSSSFRTNHSLLFGAGCCIPKTWIVNLKREKVTAREREREPVIR